MQQLSPQEKQAAIRATLEGMDPELRTACAVWNVPVMLGHLKILCAKLPQGDRAALVTHPLLLTVCLIFTALELAGEDRMTAEQWDATRQRMAYKEAQV